MVLQMFCLLHSRCVYSHNICLQTTSTCDLVHRWSNHYNSTSRPCFDAYLCARHGKSCDSINVQYVVDKNGRVCHVVSGIPGRTHNKTAIEWSEELMDFLNTLPPDNVVLGHPAYRILHLRVIHSIKARSHICDLV